MKPLVLQLRCLTERYVATAFNDRETAEWPPHPARIYSALVATWADAGVDDHAEREALSWLATLDAPDIYASAAHGRDVVPHFVPVNDPSVLKDFTNQRSKLAELEDALLRLQADAAPAKALAKQEQAIAKARTSLDTLMMRDHQAAEGEASKGVVDDAVALLPDHRGKQPRTFPSVRPDDPRVFLRWIGAPDEVDRHRPALGRVASRVTRVGHSASLVACSIVDDCPTPTWQPSARGDEVFRVPGPGQLEQLVQAYERHRGVEPRVLPCRFQRYRRADEHERSQAKHSCFDDDWIVFRQMSGPRFGSSLIAELTRTLRAALMHHAEQPPPELLSGHRAEGGPSERPHVATIGLPFVGHPHATGDVLGLALVFPREASDQERRAVLQAIGRWEARRRVELDDELADAPTLALQLGHRGVVDLARVEWGTSPLATLRPRTWCRVARVWITATPIALDRNPGNLRARESASAEAAYAAAAESIALSCERIGLDRPVRVDVHPSVPLVGAAKASAFPAFPADQAKAQRVKVHARIEFAEPVAGPILLGAGRYFGLGLCFPPPDDDVEAGP